MRMAWFGLARGIFAGLLLASALLLGGCMGDESSDSTAAQPVQLSWIPPDRRENGEPLNLGLIDHYLVHIGQESGHYADAPIKAQETRTTLRGLKPGTWYVAVRTVDTEGRLSRFSTERRITIP